MNPNPNLPVSPVEPAGGDQPLVRGQPASSADGRALQDLGDLKLTAAGTVASIAAALPAFLVGSTGVLIGAELGFDAAVLGVAIGLSFLVASAISVPSGSWTDRTGPRRALVGGCLLSLIALLGIGLATVNPLWLVVWLIVAGVGTGMLQPAVNTALAYGIVRRRAFMFGIKQSGPPLATFLAGLAIPLVAASGGWRATFGLAALLTLVVFVGLHRVIPAPVWTPSTGGEESTEGAPRIRGPLGLLAAAVALGTATAMAPAVFFVPSATASGLTPEFAGWVLAAAGLSAAGSRLFVGWLADRHPGITTRLSSMMLIAGALGCLLLAQGRPSLIWLGAVLAYACGWGWAGLLIFAAVQSFPEGPGSASGVVQAGGAAGAAAGPMAFGLVAQHGSFRLAWIMAASGAVLAAGLVEAARVGLRARRAQIDATHVMWPERQGVETGCGAGEPAAGSALEGPRVRRFITSPEPEWKVAQMDELRKQILDLQQQADRQSSRAEIDELIVRYSLALDDRDFETLAQLCTDGVVLESIGGRVEGREAFIDYYRQRMAEWGMTYHIPHGFVLDELGRDEARARVLAHAEIATPTAVIVAGVRYDDHYRREGGSWKFAERRIRQLYGVPAEEYAQRLISTERMHWPGVAPRAADLPEALPSWRKFHGEGG